MLTLQGIKDLIVLDGAMSWSGRGTVLRYGQGMEQTSLAGSRPLTTKGARSTGTDKTETKNKIIFETKLIHWSALSWGG